MNRVEVELKLNDARSWLLTCFIGLSDEQLHRPITPSEHDPDNMWSALDHFAHLALIELNFAGIVRRHLAGDANPVSMLTADDGETRTREQIMASVHKMTEKWQQKHHDETLAQVVALTASARAETLTLLSQMTDEQLLERLPGAPWADGTVGGVLGANADHARSHWGWATAAGLLSPS
jgi:hypothetical protein